MAVPTATGEPGFGFGDLDSEPANGLHHLGQGRGDAVQLFAGKNGLVDHDAEIRTAMDNLVGRRDLQAQVGSA